jgi:hypothetical protein
MPGPDLAANEQAPDTVTVQSSGATDKDSNSKTTAPPTDHSIDRQQASGEEPPRQQPAEPASEIKSQAANGQSADKAGGQSENQGNKNESLQSQADALKAEAKKLDDTMSAFSLHAQVYNSSALHQRVISHRRRLSGHTSTHEGTASIDKHDLDGKLESAEPHLEAQTKLSKTQLQSQVDTVHELHKTFETHVEQLRKLVADYRRFFDLYSSHYDKLQGDIKKFSMQAEQTQLMIMTPKLDDSPDERFKLRTAEQDLVNVLKKMTSLQERSPTLSEDYLCPAYDDLQKEFTQTLDNLVTAIKDLPKEQVQVEARHEVAQIQAIKVAMDHAEQLHVEEKALQVEYVKLQTQFERISLKHEKLVKESAKDPELKKEMKEEVDR